MMLFGNPVNGTIRAPGQTGAPYMTQDFGPTSYTGEPAVSWPGGEGIPPGYYTHFHRGIDISYAPGDADLGQPILAAAAGTVRRATSLADGNRYVAILHGDGWETRYFHLDRIGTTLGAIVAAGAVIGTMGRSGQASGVHLHYMVLKDGAVRDPWPRLVQNVTGYPKGPGINIRATAGSGTTLGAVYARTTDDGRVLRAIDKADLGPTSVPRKYGGVVRGASYVIEGRSGTTWTKLLIDGAYRYVAEPLVALSAT